MYKTITVLYIVLYGCFVLFARQPDYFDGETTVATIHFTNDSASKAIKPVANFSIGSTQYAVSARYPLRSLQDGETINVIYDAANPSKALVYSIWGYWLQWDELLVSLAIYLVLFRVAVGITSNPTPEALIEQLENKEESKRKYL